MMGSFDFLFFKQKTAYEMRISDWSSDACSSDLTHNVAAGLVLPGTDHQPTLRIDTAPIGPIHVMLLEATHRMGNSQRVYASIIRLIVDGSIVTDRNNFIGRVIINPFPTAGQHRYRDTQHGLAIGG